MTTKVLELEETDVSNLIIKYKNTRDPKIKGKIIKSYLWLVEKIARNYSEKYVTQYDDLVQVGCIGLISALEKFDPKYKASFKTYSMHFISGEMKHYIRDYVNLIKLPRELQELQPKVYRARNALSFETNDEPSSLDISNYTDLTVEKVNQVLEMENALSPVSLNQQLGESDVGSADILSNLEDKKYSSFQLSQEDKILLNDSINKIKEQSRQLLEYAFYEDLSQTEIAKKMGISQMQVSRKLNSAISELWQILNTRVTPW